MCNQHCHCEVTVFNFLNCKINNLKREKNGFLVDACNDNRKENLFANGKKSYFPKVWIRQNGLKQCWYHFNNVIMLVSEFSNRQIGNFKSNDRQRSTFFSKTEIQNASFPYSTVKTKDGWLFASEGGLFTFHRFCCFLTTLILSSESKSWRAFFDFFDPY